MTATGAVTAVKQHGYFGMVEYSGHVPLALPLAHVSFQLGLKCGGYQFSNTANHELRTIK